MTKPIVDKSIIDNYNSNYIGSLILALMDHCEEIGDKEGFVLAKSIASFRLDNGEDHGINSADIDMISLLEIGWHDKVEDYFTDWERYTCGFVPKKYSHLFTIKDTTE